MRPGPENLGAAKARRSLEHNVDEVMRGTAIEWKRIWKINVVREADNFYKSIPEWADEKGSLSKEGNICLFSWAIVGLKGNVGDL